MPMATSVESYAPAIVVDLYETPTTTTSLEMMLCVKISKIKDFLQSSNWFFVRNENSVVLSRSRFQDGGKIGLRVRVPYQLTLKCVKRGIKDANKFQKTPFIGDGPHDRPTGLRILLLASHMLLAGSLHLAGTKY